MKDVIRSYRNNLYLNFAESGDNFTLKVPHKPIWDSVIRFLRKRGWKIGKNPTYKEHYTCLSPYHKLGKKKGVALLMAISRNSIELKFGNIKNLWTGKAQSFWDDPSDDRYTQLTYLEGFAVKLEIKRIKDFCIKKGLVFEPRDEDFPAEERIVRGLQRNKHIHGEVKCLEDIKTSIKEDSYDYQRNSNDANGKKIICGDVKCFYDYRTKRIFKGVAWHNINNMWWVILPCGTLRNQGSYELFDFHPDLPRRKKLTDKKQMEMLLRIAKSYLDKGNFKKLTSLSKSLCASVSKGKEATNG